MLVTVGASGVKGLTLLEKLVFLGLLNRDYSERP